MRLQHIIEAVYCQPWAITMPGWSRVHAIVQKHLADGKLPELRAERPGTDFFGEPIPKMIIAGNGVAIIPVKGTLMQHAGMMEKMCGACSYDDIKEDLNNALGQGIENIILDIASPGGGCVGLDETCDAIDQAGEDGATIYAFADSLIASAAYDLACECEEIMITSTAFCGCIGTIMAVIDDSEAFAQAGLKMEMFASGKYKAAGQDGIPMTQDHKDYFNAMKDKFAGMFKANVRANRPGVAEETMEGQCLIGTDAMNAGLADEIVDSIDDVLELFA